METGITWQDLVDSDTNQYVRRWLKHFSALRATSIELWPEALQRAALPSLLRVLSSAERDLLVEEYWRQEQGGTSCGPEAFDPLVEVLEELVAGAQERSLQGSAFLRMGFRSPSDSPLAREGAFKIDSGSEALEIILDSQRSFEDLCLAQECSYTPSLVLRPWREVESAVELRAFLRQRRLIALSQRHPEVILPNLCAQAALLEERVQVRCQELSSAWPLDDLVVDFMCFGEEAWIVDVHPWLPWSSGALFGWEELERLEEYSFRYLL